MARALTAVLAALALAGCGGGDELIVQLSGDAEEVRLWEEVAAAYERETGEAVTVNAIGARKDHLAKLTASFAAGRPPGAFLLNHRYVADFAQRGALDPAGPRLRERRLDFIDVAADAFDVGGELQCVPQNASSLVVYFNRSRVRTPPRDYDELLALGREHGLGIEPSMIRVAPFVWDAGGSLGDFSTPQARRGLQRFLALAQAGPDATEVEAKALEDRFLEGELGMFLSSRREVPSFRTIEGFEWDVAPLPLSTTVLHSDGWCVSRAEDADAAWAFVEFATGPQGQRILARGGRTVPSLREIADSPDFLAERPPEHNEVFLAQLEQMRRLPTVAGWERAEEAANLALEQAFYGRLSLDEALARIERETGGVIG